MVPELAQMSQISEIENLTKIYMYHQKKTHVNTSLSTTLKNPSHILQKTG